MCRAWRMRTRMRWWSSGRGWDIIRVPVIFMRRRKAWTVFSLRHIRKYLLWKGWESIRQRLSVPLPMECLMRWWTAMCIGCFPVISVLIRRLIRRKGRSCLLPWRMKCWTGSSRLFTIRGLWISVRYSVRHNRLTACFARWRRVVRHFLREGWHNCRWSSTRRRQRIVTLIIFMYVRARIPL